MPNVLRINCRKPAEPNGKKGKPVEPKEPEKRGESSKQGSTDYRKKLRLSTDKGKSGEKITFDDSEEDIEEDEDSDSDFHTEKAPTLRSAHKPKKFKSLRERDEEPAKKGKGGGKKGGRVFWTDREIMCLKKGVQEDGLRGQWAEILARYPFQDCRTSVDLKDKWRNLEKYGDTELE